MAAAKNPYIPPPRPHKYIIDPDHSSVARIELTKGQWAIVDSAIVEQLCVPGEPAWYAKWDRKLGSFYARRNRPKQEGGQRQEIMHRTIVDIYGIKHIEIVDHCNHDTLDNRIQNLTPDTYANNSRNRQDQAEFVSKERGVSWYSVNRNWQARPFDKRTKKVIHLGFFKIESDAIDAVRAWRLGNE
jgi:hypothetical protein